MRKRLRRWLRSWVAEPDSPEARVHTEWELEQRRRFTGDDIRQELDAKWPAAEDTSKAPSA
jgi:hypothetical protein